MALSSCERYDLTITLTNIGLHKHISSDANNPSGKVVRRDVTIQIRRDYIQIKAGCFAGTIEEFRRNIRRVYRAGKYGDYNQFHPNVVRKARKEYLAVADFAATLQKTWCKKARRKSK